MASYQTPYDPNSYLTKGYDLPKEAIMGAISARTQYWQEGANQIKNAYASTFDFNLTNEQNKANLKIQKDQADKQLKELIKTDISIGENRAPLLKLLDPISKNENYIYDDHFTKKISGSLQQANSEKNKKGNDYFNVESVKALNNKLEDLRNADTSKSDWVDNFSNDTLGTTYIPYDPKVKSDWQDKLSKMSK